MQEKKNWVRNDDPENVSDFMPLIRSFDNAEVVYLYMLLLVSIKMARNQHKSYTHVEYCMLCEFLGTFILTSTQILP